ncbi:MAG TPA: hypothetical protein VIW03_05285 [Anaeromyxobacter sp.]
MDLFGSAEGSLGVAIAALLVVLGFRFARPSSVRDGVAFVAYAGAIATTFLRERGLIAGRAVDAGLALRLAGAAMLVVGLLIAGAAARARRLATPDPALGPGALGRFRRRAWIGLVLALLGFLARAPSSVGAVAVLVAAGVAAWAARQDEAVPWNRSRR